MIETMFQSPFFPVPYDRLPSRPAIRDARRGSVAINGFDVSAHRLNHPGGSFAYRISGANGDLVYATDHEFGNARHRSGRSRILSRGARALIVDSHFTPEEMPQHKGWGHSDWSTVRAISPRTAASAVEAVSSQAGTAGRRDEGDRGPCSGDLR